MSLKNKLCGAAAVCCLMSAFNASAIETKARNAILMDYETG